MLFYVGASQIPLLIPDLSPKPNHVFPGPDNDLLGPSISTSPKPKLTFLDAGEKTVLSLNLFHLEKNLQGFPNDCWKYLQSFDLITKDLMIPPQSNFQNDITLSFTYSLFKPLDYILLSGIYLSIYILCLCSHSLIFPPGLLYDSY